jgi:hypothetical protein
MCMLIFYIPLLVCLDNFINKTVMLFGCMSSLEIEKEVTNCKVFLEIFFKESYSVKLSTKKNNNELSKAGEFSADDVQMKPRSPSGIFNVRSAMDTNSEYG